MPLQRAPTGYGSRKFQGSEPKQRLPHNYIPTLHCPKCGMCGTVQMTVHSHAVEATHVALTHVASPVQNLHIATAHDGRREGARRQHRVRQRVKNRHLQLRVLHHISFVIASLHPSGFCLNESIASSTATSSSAATVMSLQDFTRAGPHVMRGTMSVGMASARTSRSASTIHVGEAICRR